MTPEELGTLASGTSAAGATRIPDATRSETLASGTSAAGATRFPDATRSGAPPAVVVLGPPPRWVDAARMPWTLANPLLRVQLAHARLAACAASGTLASGSSAAGATRVPDAAMSGTLASGSSAAGATRVPDATLGLEAALARFPAAVDRATTARDASVLGRALERLATLSLDWLRSFERTGPDDSDARLAAAARDVLADALRILDVVAPDRI